jgi:hypothetical protein
MEEALGEYLEKHKKDKSWDEKLQQKLKSIIDDERETEKRQQQR